MDTHNPIDERAQLRALATSYAERRRRGERPSVNEYVEQHPHLAPQLSSVLEALDRIEALGVEPAAGSAASPPASSPPASPVTATIQSDWHQNLAQTTSHPGELIFGTTGDSASIQLPAARQAAAAAPTRAGEASKYHISSTIGSGGMGTVLKAFDTDLRRWVAMKVARGEVVSNKDHLGRFIEEAQICGQLEHPNIPPVHEMGYDPKGQIYFTMKLVKGRTLQEIARDLSLGRPEVRREFTPIRIAQLIQQAAMGVHYANVRGVVHRDLKPDNIMVGDYGEVLVMDWGLAKVIGEDGSAQSYGEDPVMTSRTESGMHTLAGIVQGTPSYMSPEQARGEIARIDARTDVFGLGAVLYQLLCYQPPYAGRSVQEVVSLAQKGSPALPSKVAPKRVFIPPDLEAICMKALAAQKDDRYADARELEQDLQKYIEGTSDRERRKAHALAHAAEGRKHLANYRELEDKRDRRSVEAKHAGERISPSASIENKQTLWALQDQIEKLRMDAAQSFSRARAALDAAIQIDPTCAEARRALTDLYWERFLEAETRRDTRDAAFYRGLVEAHDDGSYNTLLQGDGTVTLESNPSGAEVTLHRYREENRILVPTDAQMLGTTPLNPVTLPMGSYLAVLRRPGCRDTRYPFSLGRSENHHGRVRLYSEGEIGADFVHVPAGEFTRGGDPDSYGGFDRSKVHLEDFFIGKFPVTLGEYCEFLDALSARGDDAGIKEHVPRQVDVVYVEQGEDGKWRPVKEHFEASAQSHRHPPGFALRCPVFAVNWHSASAYARWRSENDGRELTLPPEDAWEKAARGVDSRFHPWGDFFDWTFAKGGQSRAEKPEPEPVGTFPRDDSPYGVQDLAGTIREWTSSWFDQKAATYVVRGGSWNLTVERHFRATTRFGYQPGARVTTFGFRLFSWEKARPTAGTNR